MRSSLIWEDAPREYYPASLEQDGIFFKLTFPDFPEIATIREPTISEVLETGEKNLGWAIRKRMETGVIFPYASSAESIKGEVCLIKPTATPPIIGEE